MDSLLLTQGIDAIDFYKHSSNWMTVELTGFSFCNCDNKSIFISPEQVKELRDFLNQNYPEEG